MARWLLSVAAALLFAASSVAATTTVKVVTQQAMLRQDSRFFAPVVAKAKYGEILQVLERRGDWVRVQYQGKSGWLHASAVEEQKFRLSSLMTAKAKETSQDEVALAGKGFTPEVEKAFRDKNPEMKFDLVDRIERLQVPPPALESFIREGGLREPGGES